MTAVVAVVVAGVASYLLRAVPLLVPLGPRPAAVLERVAPHVAPAAFTALAATALLELLDGSTATGPRLAAVAATAVVADRTRRPTHALAAGLGVLWVASAAVALVHP